MTLEKLRLQRDHLFASIRSWLNEQDEQSLADSFLPNGKAAEPSVANKQDAWSREAKRFHADLPTWYQAGLGCPDLLADFDYWSKIARYNLAEAALLSLGLEPVDFLVERLEAKRAKRKDNSQADDFALRRFEMMRRQFAPHSRSGIIYPKDFIEWLRSINLDCHPAFCRMIEIVETRLTDKTVQTDGSEGPSSGSIESAPEGREVASLAKLLTAIAMEEYGYNPTSRRSPIPREIQDITDRQGLSVSQDTIRKYLQIGAKYLPRDSKAEE